MRGIFLTKFLVGLALTTVLLWSANPAKAQIEPIELIQSRQALLADQRLVGNVSAQAKREGVIVNTPELFIYYSDFSPAYHLSGYRGTLSRELGLIVDRHRIERSMVDLDRLLERAETPDGDTLEIDQLPDADLYVVIYQRPNCASCEQVQSAVDALIERTDLALSLIIVRLERP